MRRPTFRLCALTLLAAPLALGGCAADDEVTLPGTGTPVSAEVDALFARYVALGNSITAGFQSGGINDSTQRRAYPVLVARQAGAESRFLIPSLSNPGCPPPFAAPLSTTRISTIPCALRAAPAPRTINNLAVPGARIASALNINDAANSLTTFILGGRTPVETMLRINPTLVTAWLGNNDALGAALLGETALLTAVGPFQASLDALVAAINSTPAGRDDAVVLIGVVNPVVIPTLQPGAFAFAVKSNPQTAPLLPKTVNANCSPVTATGQPNPLSRNLVSLQILSDPRVPEISCADDAKFLLTPAELGAISARVAEFNGLLRARAETNGWIYIDPNPLLQSFLSDPNRIRKCQGLATARTQAEFGAAVVQTCPSPDPRVGFGSLFSFDGFHPSTEAQVILANTVIAALNAKFGVSIPII